MRTIVRRTALIALLSLIAVAADAADADAEHPMLGEEAPDFSLESLDGETVTLSELRGSPVVVHFGAGW